MIRVLILLIVLSSESLSLAQQKFDPAQLQSPKTNGPLIDDRLITKEVYEYTKDEKNCIILRNGFGQSTFINANDWTLIKDTVKVERIEIVYSKYPIRDGVYKEFYSLLFSRIKATIELDPDLNDEKILWNKVLQTNCIDNTQVNNLLHGVIIWYSILKPKKSEGKADIKELKGDTKTKIDRLNKERKENEKQEKQFQEVRANVDYILASPHLPDSVREIVINKPLDKQLRYLEEFFIQVDSINKKVGSSENEDLTHLHYLNEVNLFLQGFPSVEPVISKVLDRHPEWRNKIVINDWTGSMYAYGAQVVAWHLMNLKSSGISTITLFNDGNGKTTKHKRIGSTGGIYSEKTSDIPELLELFKEVMKKGGGGDSPENDVEAILEAIEDQPESSEIILIADNGACVRDIELANRINRPVRIILCGFDPKEGVNAHYVYLAKVTGGGIYTIKDDVVEINASLGKNGTIESYEEKRIRLKSPQCYSGDFGKLSSREFMLNQARWQKNRVRILNASNSELSKLPNYVFRIKNLQVLIADHNNIHEVSGKIERLKSLNEINFSNNQISSLPDSFRNVKYLQSIDFSHNNFNKVPDQIIALKFLRQLNMSNNNLTKFKDLESKHLKHLDLSNNRLIKIPSLENHSELIELNLSGNEITSISSNIELTKHLKVLNLANNKLTHLPNDLSDYTQLKILDLSGNNLPFLEQDRIRQMLFYTDIRF